MPNTLCIPMKAGPTEVLDKERRIPIYLCLMMVIHVLILIIIYNKGALLQQNIIRQCASPNN